MDLIFLNRYMNFNYTVLLPIFNEPVRIYPILKNFEGIAKVLVLLDSSDTKTKSILIQKNIDFVIRPYGFFERKLKYQIAWMLQQIDTEYFLFSNASTYYPENLLDEFGIIADEGKYDGVKNSMYYWSHGKLVLKPFILKKSTSSYFFRKSAIQINKSKIHAEFQISDDKDYLVLPPKSDYSVHVFLDDDIPTRIEKNLKYAKREAKQFLNEGFKIGFKHVFFIPLKTFIVGYIRLGGFLAGIEGLMFHLNSAIYKFMVYSYLFELSNNKTFERNREVSAKYRLDLLQDIKFSKNKSFEKK